MTSYLLRGDAELLERYRPALATLPVTFTTDADSGAAAIWVVDGSRAAGEHVRGAAAVIVDLPSGPLAGAGALTDAVPALPWAGSAAARQLPAIGPDVRLITADFALGPSDERTLAGCAWDLAMLLERSAPGTLELDPPRENGSVISARGRVGGAAVLISGVRSAAGRGAARVSWRGVDRDVVVELPAPGTAWPGSCTVHDAAGSRTDPLHYSDFRREALLAAVSRIS